MRRRQIREDDEDGDGGEEIQQQQPQEEAEEENDVQPRAAVAGRSGRRRSTMTRQERLRRELEELQEHQRTLFPDDPAFEALLRTTQVQDEDAARQTNDNDDVDSEQDEDYDGVVVSKDDDEDDNDYDDWQGDEAQFFRREAGEEDDEGEDLLENVEDDYQAIPALDTYGKEGLDERDYDLMDYDQRLQAEEVLNQRDMERRAARGAGARSFFYETLLNQPTEEEDEQNRRARRGQFRSDPTDMIGDDDRSRGDGEDEKEAQEEELDEEELFETEDTLNLEAFDVPVQEWITQDRTRREVIRNLDYSSSTFKMMGTTWRIMPVYANARDGMYFLFMKIVFAPCVHRTLQHWKSPTYT